MDGAPKRVEAPELLACAISFDEHEGMRGKPYFHAKCSCGWMAGGFNKDGLAKAFNEHVEERLIQRRKIAREALAVSEAKEILAEQGLTPRQLEAVLLARTPDQIAGLVSALEPFARGSAASRANCKRLDCGEPNPNNIIALGFTYGDLRRAEEALATWSKP